MKSDAAMSAIPSRARPWAGAIVLILVAALSGCASTNARDPLEPFNRTVYSFNEVLDDVIVRPLAQGYRAVLPPFARTGIRNFFSNLDDVTVFVNNLLQLKVPQAAADLGRFVINSTVGVLGFVDVATHLGLEKHNEDFGQTLGYWGVGSGPYLVLPLLGPSSVRDGIGRLVDVQIDLVWQVSDISTRNILLGTRAVSTRTQLLDSEKILETAALDPYSFIRDAYLQRRRNLVHDGNPPPELEEEPAPPAKPRSELSPVPVAILVDSYGNVVAGPPLLVPVAMEPAASPAQAMPAKPADGASDGAAKAAPAGAPAPTERDPGTEVRGEAPAAGSVVRIWLSGSGR
jgi:phospholipid-binding lipoprotein MlaA